MQFQIFEKLIRKKDAVHKGEGAQIYDEKLTFRKHGNFMILGSLNRDNS